MNLIFAIGQDGKPKLCVGALPGRKRPSLYLWTALDIIPLASFRNQKAADIVVRFLIDMIDARITDGDIPTVK